jgi:ATP-dependent DNA helicase RecG
MAEPSFIKRLKALGITDIADLVMIMPNGYQDMRQVRRHLNDVVDGVSYVFVAVLVSPLVSDGTKNGSPSARAILRLEDGSELTVSLFGGLSTLSVQWNPFVGLPLYWFGQVRQFGKHLVLTKPEIIEDQYVGKLRPSYSGKPKVISAETIRSHISQYFIDALPMAIQKLRASLLGDALIRQVIDPSRLHEVFHAVHFPVNEAQANRALEVLDHLAALYALNKLQEHETSVSTKPITSAYEWRLLLGRLPFKVRDDQYQAIEGIIQTISQPTAMRGILLGDVGSGKTAVYAIVSAWAVWCGHRVAIMLPSTTLAKQVFNEVCSYFPKISALLVDGETKQSEKLAQYRLLVGTTALLHRDAGELSLVIIDEQQRYSVEQREQLTSQTAHLLEVSATPIPRTMALIKHEAMQLWQLQADVPNKKISSLAVIGETALPTLHEKVASCLSLGHQVIIVYSLKESDEKQKLLSAEEAFVYWNRLYPNRVVLAHSDNDKDASISAMRNGHADVLISTTVIEVGVTLPRVMLLAVVNPERFGLIQLHQLRGRIARQGGHGLFLLCMPEAKYAPKTLDRMRAVVNNRDGFALAKIDCDQRGSGDLSKASAQQTGDDSSFLINRPINLDLVESLMSQSISIHRRAA